MLENQKVNYNNEELVYKRDMVEIADKLQHKNSFSQEVCQKELKDLQRRNNLLKHRMKNLIKKANKIKDDICDKGTQSKVGESFYQSTEINRSNLLSTKEKPLVKINYYRFYNKIYSYENRLRYLKKLLLKNELNIISLSNAKIFNSGKQKFLRDEQSLEYSSKEEVLSEQHSARESCYLQTVVLDKLQKRLQQLQQLKKRNQQDLTTINALYEGDMVSKQPGSWHYSSKYKVTDGNVYSFAAMRKMLEYKKRKKYAPYCWTKTTNKLPAGFYSSSNTVALKLERDFNATVYKYNPYRSNLSDRKKGLFNFKHIGKLAQVNY
ncbi:hypothetical protein PRVXT_001543 [Proteinivorax tanatarense]|uniref:Uncharacterized protein n=1 Tax=Proteinivorax tanatarense TaxID=1260629 RepID=A0AAU7VI66_9FIRM